MTEKTRKLLTNHWLQLALILAVAAFFRLWQIDALPPGLFGDEATDGLDALDILAGRGAIFFPANYGREGLHMWIVAGMFKLLGVTPLALRLPSAIAGILTALATYWLGWELVWNTRRQTAGRRRQTAGRRPLTPNDSSSIDRFCQPSAVHRLPLLLPLLAALYIATSFWHVHFSRFGIRGVFTPLFGALTFAAFWRGVNGADSRAETASPRSLGQPGTLNPAISSLSPYVWFASSGLFMGLATHFYTASRFFPFFLGGFLILQAFAAYARGRREEILVVRHFKGLVLLCAVAGLVFAPLGVYFLRHPGSFAQRASEVVAFGEASPWLRMGQAALANAAQFFLPGGGDMAQFYNLPGRAVFDPLTAVLALIGIGALLWQWRQPAALFLLTWWPMLLVPSFLATDRYPTLPRVLGVVPGVYFFPAVGLVVVVVLVRAMLAEQGNKDTMRKGNRSSVLPRLLVSLFLIAALLTHATRTYRDYFRSWGPSQSTFDAFDGDMTAAWRWLKGDDPAGHIYLSSDIYRHPTFMLLGERATVSTYFQHQNLNLSWFDARRALPLPPSGQPATYLLASSASPGEIAEQLFREYASEGVPIPAPDGTPALRIIDLEPSGESPAASQTISFSENLALTGANWLRTTTSGTTLKLNWQVRGSDPQEWPGYRLEIAIADQVVTESFDAYRPPEWVPLGRFITWHAIEVPGELPERLALRLIRVRDGQPLARENSPGGWHTIQSVVEP